MTTTHYIDRRTVRSALALAAAAPSIHNSRPWRWAVGPRSIHLHADLARFGRSRKYRCTPAREAQAVPGGFAIPENR